MLQFLLTTKVILLHVHKSSGVNMSCTCTIDIYGYMYVVCIRGKLPYDEMVKYQPLSLLVSCTYEHLYDLGAIQTNLQPSQHILLL